MPTEEHSERTRVRYSPFVPLALLAVTFLVMVGFQAIQLSRERDALETSRANQETPLEESKKVRAQLDSIAKNTAVLAAQGNENAKALIDQLRQHGITVNPNSGSSQ